MEQSDYERFIVTLASMGYQQQDDQEAGSYLRGRQYRIITRPDRRTVTIGSGILGYLGYCYQFEFDANGASVGHRINTESESLR